MVGPRCHRPTGAGDLDEGSRARGIRVLYNLPIVASEVERVRGTGSGRSRHRAGSGPTCCRATRSSKQLDRHGCPSDDRVAGDQAHLRQCPNPRGTHRCGDRPRRSASDEPGDSSSRLAGTERESRKPVQLHTSRRAGARSSRTGIRSTAHRSVGHGRRLLSSLVRDGRVEMGKKGPAGRLLASRQQRQRCPALRR